jgi:mRNA-degrading endonuclease RelE of RelBE toxin-antitoxin system
MEEKQLFEFVWLPTFERTSRKLLSESDRRAIEGVLCDRLDVGPLLQRTGGLRKMRYARKLEGKRGGVRVIYLPDEECGRVYMVLAYSKGRKDSLTRVEEQELMRLTTELKREDC